MISADYSKVRGTRCPLTKTASVYTLSNSNVFPDFKRIPGQRDSFESSKNYHDLEKSILQYKKVFVPIVVTPDGYLVDGVHRSKIARKLWDKGIDVEITVIEQEIPEDDKAGVVATVQEGKAWGPEDFLKSQAELGNESAKYVLELAERPFEFSKRDKFGVRNALKLTYGGFPQGYMMPEELDPLIKINAERLFNEITLLFHYGRKSSNFILNNWTESFINAWRRIRMNAPNTASENEEGVKTVIDTRTLNAMIDDIGLTKIGTSWPCFAQKAFSTTRLGQWIEMFEKMILQLHAAQEKYTE